MRFVDDRRLCDELLRHLRFRWNLPTVGDRIGVSWALKIGGAVYQIDCGLGCLNAFANAGLRFDQLRSLFITHLHTDHIVDLLQLLSVRWLHGLTGQGEGHGVRAGPGRRVATE